MNAAIEQVVVSAVAAAAALVAAVLWRKLAPAAWPAHFALPLGAAIGFFAGYCVFPDEWAPLWPGRPTWQRLPYLAFAAALAGSVPEKAGWLARWPALAVVAATAAWLLVPPWDDLYPPRMVSVGLLALYLLALGAALDALPARLFGRWFAGSLVAVAAVLAMVLLAFGASAKIAQICAGAASALAGGFAATFFAGLNSAKATRGLVPVYVVLAGSLAYVGAIEPTTPRYWLLLVPLLPLGWWLFAFTKRNVTPAK